MSVGAVLFDVDGTLAETEADGHRVAFNRAFADDNLAWHWDQARYGELLTVTGGRERIAFFAATDAPDWLAAPDAQQRIAALHARKNAHYARIVEDGELQLRPGLAALFGQLRQHRVRLAIVTTTSRANVDVLLRVTLGEDAINWFSVYVCGEDVQRKKPDPEAYRLALQRLDLPARACVAVEDSGNGLRAALGARIDTFIVRSRYCRDDDFAGAAAVFDGFATGDGPGLTVRHLLDHRVQNATN